MKVKEYNRKKAVEYAIKWAYKRNPKYYNFDSVGGDCTSFISQCIYAGSGIMNYKKHIGWYYNSSSDRTASWSGVEFLYNFLSKKTISFYTYLQCNYKNLVYQNRTRLFI